MKAPLKILFLPKWYPNKFDAFDGNFIQNHALAVQQLHDVTVLFAHSDPHLDSTYQIVSTNFNGVSEIRVYFKKPNFKYNSINLFFSFIRYYTSLVKAYKIYKKTNRSPDICHVHVLSKTSLVALYLFWTKKIPYLITEHWTGYHKENQLYQGFLKKILTRLSVKYAKKVTVVSKNLENAMKNYGLHGNYQWIPNVVDTDVFKPLPKKNTEKKRLIHIANLNKKHKNTHLIVQCLTEISQVRNDFEFILVGSGIDKEEILNTIENSLLATVTTYKGELKMNEVAHELAKSDALLLFSSFENQPCVIIEAFACGVPVITSNAGGIPEMMNDSLGIMVPLEIEKFKSAIVSFLDEKKIYTPENLRQYALANFSRKKVAEVFDNIYAEVLKN